MSKLAGLAGLEKLADLKILKDLMAFVHEAKATYAALDTGEVLGIVRDFLNDQLDTEQKIALGVVLRRLKLEDEVAQLRDSWNGLPDQARSLFKPLSQLGLVELSILGENHVSNQFLGPWQTKLNFLLDPSLGLEIEGLEDGDSELRDLKISPGSGNSILKLTLSGCLSAAGDAKATLTTGAVRSQVRVSSSTSGSTNVVYYFRGARDSMLVEILMKVLTMLVSPFDCRAVALACDDRLAALRCQTEYHLNAGLKASAAAIWGSTVQVECKAIKLNDSVSIGAGAGLSFSIGRKLGGAFNLLFLREPDQDNSLRLKLYRARSKEKNTAYNIDANMGIMGLDKISEALMKKFVPDPGNLLEELKLYLNLGDLLKQMLEKQLNGLEGLDETSRDELIDTLTGVSTSSGLVHAILVQLTDIVNQQSVSLSEEVKKEGHELAVEVADRLGLTGALKADLVDILSHGITDELGKLKASLTEKLDALVAGKGREALEKLFKPLQDLGENVASLVEDANQASTKLLTPVIKLLERYQTYRAKLQLAIANSAKLKFALAISRSLQKTNRSSADLEFLVDASDESASELVRQMLLGSFQDALVASRSEKPAVNLVGGTFVKHLNRQVCTDISLNLAGLSFTDQTTLCETTENRLDLANNRLTTRGSTEFLRCSRGLGEERSVHFVNLFELAGATSGKMLTSALTLSVADKNTHAKELKKAFRSLEQAGLIALGSTARILMRQKDLAKANSTKLGATYGANLPLSMDDLTRLAKQSDSTVRQVALDSQIDVYYPGGDQLECFEDVVARIGISGNRTRKIVALSRTTSSKNDAANFLRIRSHKGRILCGIAWHLGRNALNLVTIKNIIRDLLALPLNCQDLEEQTQIIQGKLRRYNTCLKGWLKVRNSLMATLGRNDRFPKDTLAFISAIHKLTCEPGSTVMPLIPTIQWQLADRNLNDLIL